MRFRWHLVAWLENLLRVFLCGHLWVASFSQIMPGSSSSFIFAPYVTTCEQPRLYPSDSGWVLGEFPGWGEVSLWHTPGKHEHASVRYALRRAATGCRLCKHPAKLLPEWRYQQAFIPTAQHKGSSSCLPTPDSSLAVFSSHPDGYLGRHLPVTWLWVSLRLINLRAFILESVSMGPLTSELSLLETATEEAVPSVSHES